jgi:hypothetical protein
MLRRASAITHSAADAAFDVARADERRTASAPRRAAARR